MPTAMQYHSGAFTLAEFVDWMNTPSPLRLVRSGDDAAYPTSVAVGFKSVGKSVCPQGKIYPSTTCDSTSHWHALKEVHTLLTMRYVGF